MTRSPIVVAEVARYSVVIATFYCVRDCAIVIFYAAKPSAGKKNVWKEAMLGRKGDKLLKPKTIEYDYARFDRVTTLLSKLR